jgi:hypothetical protein
MSRAKGRRRHPSFLSLRSTQRGTERNANRNTGTKVPDGRAQRNTHGDADGYSRGCSVHPSASFDCKQT